MALRCHSEAAFPPARPSQLYVHIRVPEIGYRSTSHAVGGCGIPGFPAPIHKTLSNQCCEAFDVNARLCKNPDNRTIHGILTTCDTATKSIKKSDGPAATYDRQRVRMDTALFHFHPVDRGDTQLGEDSTMDVEASTAWDCFRSRSPADQVQHDTPK